ncbi:MAG: cell division topological specificity factor MinE [Zoogloeaceae bacterium]|nr:cell division topological specificity factor MinE [Zoogloeaceae bacterium]
MNSLFSRLFRPRPRTADIARERLQLVIAHERNGQNNTPDFLPALQKDLVAVISRYVAISPEDIKVSLEKEGNCEILEVNIVLPEIRSASFASAL